MNLSFLEVLKIFTVFQISLIVIFLLFNSTRKSHKNLFLTIFISSKALSIADTLLIAHNKEVTGFLMNLTGIGFSFQLILGPALFFIMKEITQRKVELKIKHVLHLIPFLIYIVWLLFHFQFQDITTKVNLFHGWFPFSAPWFRTAYTLFYIHFAIYGISSLFVLSKSLKEIYKVSSFSVEKNIFFLKFLVYDFVTVWGIYIISMYVYYGSTGVYILNIITTLNIFFIANAVVYQGLKFPKIFLEAASGKQKYEKNPLEEEEKDVYVDKLQKFMAENKPYLNPTLSLADLAKEVDLSPFILSQLLNQVINQNFYDYINNYRIEESKQLLSNTGENNKTILEILYQCGFNSKSVFNSAFKKSLGMTPSEYKKSTTGSLNQDSISPTFS